MSSRISNDRALLLSGARRVVVKIGSSLITSKDHGLNPARLETYGDEVARLKKKGYEILLVSSGAIISGLEKLKLRWRPRSLPENQAAAAVGQSRLMWAYERIFEARGLIVAQVLLTRDDLTDRKRFLNSRNTLTTLLDLDVIPVINENDTVAVDEIRFGDNDSLAGLVTHLIDAHLLIILSDVQGLYTEDPRLNPQATVIHTVREVTPEITALAGTPSGEEGVGGMASKIQAAGDVAAYGVPTVIAGGQKASILERILSGEEIGTIVLPQGDRLTSRKHWIAYTLRSKGRLVLDDGAVEALTQKGKSLLPSGIIKVEGRFESGDAVSCMNPQGREVARGLVNYTAGEVSQMKGIKTSEVSKVLGYKGYDEVIHRDNLVIL